MENNLEGEIIVIIQRELEQAVSSYIKQNVGGEIMDIPTVYGTIFIIEKTASRIREIFLDENAASFPNLNESLLETAINKAVFNTKIKFKILENASVPDKLNEGMGVFVARSSDEDEEIIQMNCLAGSYPLFDWIEKYEVGSELVTMDKIYLCSFKQRRIKFDKEDVSEYDFSFINEVQIEEIPQAIKELGFPKCIDEE